MKTLRPIASNLLRNPTRSSTSQCRAVFLANGCFQCRTPNTPTQRRTFVSNLNPFGPQVLTATRTIHHPARLIFDIISDVSQYDHFVPYCRGSVVTKTSNPAKDGKSYPEEAKLVVGFSSDVSEEFWSRVYCVPETVVEAVSGSMETTLSPEEVEHHNARPAPDQDPTRQGKVLSQLLTRWTLRPFPYKPPPASALHPDSTQKNHQESSQLPSYEKTEVRLAIEYQFANPAYAALSSAAAPKVAEKMIDAFEKRVKAIVEGPGHVDGAMSGKGRP